MQDGLKILVLLIPALPVAIVYYLYAKRKKSNWLEGVGLSLFVNGCIWAPVTFLGFIAFGMSGKLKFHDTAGLGYMILLFVGPLAVFIAFAIPGAILMWIGNMFSSSLQQKNLALSPEALAILHGLNAPPPKPPLPTQATWRDFARHA